ncbi:hypothetical protein DES53_10686 [Roseimicrobium gellanilyticum]|uniref:DUF6268 domain-containing protein n=1 Tax=Roseimicrobium gellanilyticum TaxID=748857 RepID=A0A366HJU4_9BACT|nr:DUF6268 family outer membrane beta-barrel protein [Roseimicrobium gellanilyticum]RBP42380.1 hypothetical protein DES53_10686 [Roseimicrobium gellanilyticum]
MRLLFHSCLSVFFTALTTALVPAAELIDPAARGFGKPSYALDFTWQDELSLDDGPGGLEMWEARALVPLAKFGDENLMFGLSLGYEARGFDLGGEIPIDTDLHVLETQVAVRWQPKDSRWWGLGFVTPGLATDFEDVDGDAFNLTALAIAGYQWSDTLDFAGGVVMTYDLGDVKVYPALGFIWEPSKEFIVQATPPIVAVGWRPVDSWTLALVTYPAGGGWSVGSGEEEVRQIDLTLWRAALSLEKSVGDHWSFSLRAGVSFGGELELRSESERVLRDTDLDPAIFAAAAVKWSF